MTNRQACWFAGAAVCAWLLSNSSAEAFPPVAMTARTANAAATGAASPFAAHIAALRQVRQLLETADHDYNGHRAAAVKLVSSAIHELHPHKTGTAHRGTKHAGTSHANAGGQQNAAHHMPQAASDAQLKQALTQLAAVQGQLGGMASNQQAAAASGLLQRAAKELQTALSIK